MKLFNQLLLMSIGAQLFISAVPLTSNYILAKGYNVTIHGTSNLHSWDETVQNISGEARVHSNSKGDSDLETLVIKMDVRSIKSDKGAIMNNNTYKALKADAHPQIIFILSKPLESIPLKSAEKTVFVKGDLSIAGVTKAIVMEVKIAMPAPGKLSFEGIQPIKMSDYKIKPPTALLGTLKTGDDITIHFKTVFALKTN